MKKETILIVFDNLLAFKKVNVELVTLFLLRFPWIKQLFEYLCYDFFFIVKVLQKRLPYCSNNNSGNTGHPFINANYPKFDGGLYGQVLLYIEIINSKRFISSNFFMGDYGRM